MNTNLKQTLKKFKKAYDERLEEGQVIPALSNNLDSKVMNNDITAYNFRTAGGSLEIGDYCKVNSIIGGSLGFNQLGKELNSTNWYGDYANVSFANGVATFTATGQHGGLVSNYNFSLVSGHRYLLTAQVKLTIAGTDKRLFVRDNTTSTNLGTIYTVSTTNKQTLSGVFVPSVNTDQAVIKMLDSNSGGTFGAIEVSNVQVIDLTAMFGSIIADYINTLETQTPGAGVAWFRKYFPKDYYAYTPIGSFVNIITKGKKYVGFNQFDINKLLDLTGWSKSNGVYSGPVASIIGNYYFNSKNSSLIKMPTNYNGRYQVYIKGYATTNSSPNIKFVYDDDSYSTGFTISSTNQVYVGTSTSGKKVVRIGFSYNTGGTFYIEKFCISMFYDGERDGEYEDYESHTVDLDTSWDSIGIPQIDENGNLYFDGNKYNYDGTVDEEYYEYTFAGNESWTWSGTFWSFTSYLTNLPSNQTPLIANGIVAILYQNSGIFRVYPDDNPQITSSSNMNSIFPSGTKMIYKKSSITQSTATSFPQVQFVDNWGTEQFLAPDGDTRVCEVPVGHDTDYPLDCKSKLEIAPDLPENDGEYVCKVESGTASYVSLASWLSSNGYVNQTDETSKITKNVSSLVYNTNSPVMYKTGKIVTIGLSVYNSSQTAVASGTTLFTLDSSITPVSGVVVSGYIGDNAVKTTISRSGEVKCGADIPYDTAFIVFATYAVV